MENLWRNILIGGIIAYFLLRKKKPIPEPTAEELIEKQAIADEYVDGELCKVILTSGILEKGIYKPGILPDDFCIQGIAHLTGQTFSFGDPFADEQAEEWRKESKASSILDDMDSIVIELQNDTAIDTEFEIVNATEDENVWGGAKLYDDWFLPSEDLLQAIRTNLYNEGVGNLQDGEYYWSSTEVIATQAHSRRMINNADFNQNKSNVMHVRACRSFTAAIGAYSLRDVGQAGGLICHINGNTYYEAAPSDESDSIWSNIDNIEIGASAQGTAIGTGQANTLAILAQAGHTNSAAKLCDDLKITN